MLQEGQREGPLKRKAAELPAQFQRALLEAGWTDVVLGCLVVEKADAERIVQGLLPGVEGLEKTNLVDALLERAQKAAELNERSVSRLAQQASQPGVGVKQLRLDTGEIYDNLVAGHVELARKVYKSKAQGLRRAEVAEPEKIELEETRRWATVIAGFIIDSPMPAKEMVESTGDPVATWVRLCGNRRSRTLRQAARSWQRFHEWLQLSSGLKWPTSVAQVVDYLEERMLEPCGPTIPGSLLGSLQLLESIGGQEPAARLGSSPMLANVVKNMEKDLSISGPPRKTAPIYTVAMVISAELLVADRGEGVVPRALAYRSRTALTEVGWRSVLVRSKTSGAGRRVCELPVFISRKVCLSGEDWLLAGHDLWKDLSENFPGTLFLCKPRADASEFTKKYLDATCLAAWLKWTLTQLPSLKRVIGGWDPVWTNGLLTEDWAARWFGHSARHCLPSWGAAVGILRAFLGRWRAGVEVDMTSRQIVHAAQEKVARAFCTGDPQFSETEVFDEMRLFAKERGLEIRPALWEHIVWKRRESVVAMFLNYPTVDIKMVPGILGDEDDIPLIPEEDGEEAAAPFWISISRRTGFRRLHRHQGCGVSRSTVFKSMEVSKITADVADKKCRICFRDETGSKESEGDDTSSGSSSSSSSSEEEQEEEP